MIFARGFREKCFYKTCAESREKIILTPFLLRWYGSRGLGLAMAITAIALSLNASNAWIALAILLPVMVTLAVAAWSAFCNSGADCPRPWIGQVALGTTVAVGLVAVGASLLGLLAGLLGPSDYTYTRYVLSKDMEWLRVTESSRRGSLAAEDLAGNPRPEALEELRQRGSKFCQDIPYLVWNHGGEYGGRYADAEYYYMAFFRTGAEVWYYVRGSGNIEVYDFVHSRRILTLTPNDYGRTQPLDGSELRSMHRSVFGEDGVVALRDMVLLIDRTTRRVQILSAAAEDTGILSAGMLGTTEPSTPPLVAIIGERYLRVCDVDGDEIFTWPHPCDTNEYPTIRMGRREDNDRVLVWYQLSGLAVGQPRQPDLFFELDRAGNVLASRELPPIPREMNPVNEWFLVVGVGLAPPAAVATGLTVALGSV